VCRSRCKPQRLESQLHRTGLEPAFQAAYQFIALVSLRCRRLCLRTLECLLPHAFHALASRGLGGVDAGKKAAEGGRVIASRPNHVDAGEIRFPLLLAIPARSKQVGPDRPGRLGCGEAVTGK
jgi:hypothetical protein